MVWFIVGAVVVLVFYFWQRNAGFVSRLPSVGDAAPAFSLPDQHGAARTLEEFLGKWLVLYFYPRDDTPGCAEQAMRFRNSMRDLESLGATVCGVSVDDSASHAAFALKYKLPFTLLADRDGTVARLYGSLRDFGILRFAKRNTFLVDRQGKVAKVYVGVNPARNAQQVHDDLKSLASR